ncbi:MAG TPA: hypothetical protein VMT76_00815 [Puia sp.]|nr:hypothetical protein [Puia sp.]
MLEKELNVTGGVLIIGSLLWQNNLGRQNNTIRNDWRKQFLDESQKIKVNVPIRYGRLSGGEVYTMTFSNSCRIRLGSAYLVPFRQNPVKNFAELLTESQELSYAEGMDRKFIKSRENIPWSVLGLLFNNGKIALDNKKQMSDWWQQQIQHDQDYGLFNHKTFKLGSERPSILQNGQLNFPWINPVDPNAKTELNNYDFLIATTTLPNEKKYPTVNKLVTNIHKDQVRKYFIDNHAHGITTFQDQRIIKKLSQNFTKNIL